MGTDDTSNPANDPPFTRNEAGDKRNVGVEIEFTGLKVGETADLIVQRFGGAVVREGTYRVTIKNTQFGDFLVELDMQYAHARGKGELERTVADAMGAVGELFAPIEIVAPPIAYDRLPELDRLVGDIRRAGAGGTGSAWFAAYGCHLNPEVAQTDAPYITAHIKAYLVLSDWLRAGMKLDLARQITPFIDPFPASYARTVTAPGYWPDMGKLINDYLDANPTRNRELDMLPLFAHLDPDRINAALDDERIKARPTFHYRLPNSRVDEPHWSVIREWNRWLSVERLAADRDRLDEACAAYTSFQDRLISFGWAREAERWA
ncbi:MAG: amidoligase family protein [Sphingomonadales bacterium]